MIKKWIRDWVKRHFYVYAIEELQIGGNCGCCGAWIADCIVPKVWPWSVCKKCWKGAGSDA